VPKVSEVFDQFQRDLPVMTEVLISTCDFIRVYWWLVLLLVFGAVMTIRQYKKTEKGRRWWDGLVLRLPTVGALSLKLSVARFARTLGTLVQSGLPMLTALDIVKRIVGNAVIEEAIEQAKKGVRKGEDLATPLRASKVFPPILIHMVALGEKSGQLESMLVKVADSYEEEVDMTVNTLVSLLEPLMVMVMGVFVGFMVLAILLPIFDLSQAVG
jgi:general secretion pathway protein F